VIANHAQEGQVPDPTTIVRTYIEMWNETDPQPVAVGIDFATTADDGRLRSVTGFLEQSAA